MHFICINKMKFVKQNINGLYLIKPEPYKDKRGMLRRHFCQKEIKKTRMDFIIRQSNISENKKKHTLRGFHYQIKPYTESKIISVLSGSIYNITIDLRKKSSTFLKITANRITGKQNELLLIPAGCANAFLTTSNNTIVHYYMSSIFEEENKKKYKGFRYDDKFFNLRWLRKPKIISKKDKSYKPFKLDRLI